jgi:hypothetical protein
LTHKSTEIKKSQDSDSEITQNFVIIEATVYMTAVTHGHQQIVLEIRLEIKKSHYKSTEISLAINSAAINLVRFMWPCRTPHS